MAFESPSGRILTGAVSVTISTNFTRPADTTAYAAGDAVTNSTSAPTILTFTGAARLVGMTGLITDAVLIDEANQATKGQFELHLYDTTFTPNNDNAAFAPTVAVAETEVGVIEFPTAFASTNADTYHAKNVNLGFATLTTANLFGELVVRNAYTPVSGEKFTIRLKIIQD